MRRVLALALFALLVVQPGAAAFPLDDADAARSPTGLAGAPATAESGALDGNDAVSSESLFRRALVRQQQSDEADWYAGTTFRVQLHESGDSTWAVSMRYRLDDENETAAFRTYADAFERGEAVGAVDPALFEGLAAGASEVADREMAVQNVSRSARVDGDTGVLTLSFTWTNFLSRVPNSDHLVLRDALLLPDGRTWLATLEPSQRLVIETPPGYAINATSVPVLQRSNTVIIDGPRTFSADEPLTIRYQPTSQVAQTPWAPVVGVVAVAVIAAIAAVLWRRRGGTTADTDTSSTGVSPESADGDTAADPAVDSPADGAPDVASDVAPADGSVTDDEPEEDLSLLSDEERVERMLERNGGRMKQTQIVERSGWSDAKVSQLLSAMAEEGRVEKLRIGRENLISLPERDVIDDTEDGSGDDSAA